MSAKSVKPSIKVESSNLVSDIKNVLGDLKQVCFVTGISFP